MDSGTVEKTDVYSPHVHTYLEVKAIVQKLYPVASAASQPFWRWKADLLQTLLNDTKPVCESAP